MQNDYLWRSRKSNWTLNKNGKRETRLGGVRIRLKSKYLLKPKSSYLRFRLNRYYLNIKMNIIGSLMGSNLIQVIIKNNNHSITIQISIKINNIIKNSNNKCTNNNIINNNLLDKSIINNNTNRNITHSFMIQITIILIIIIENYNEIIIIQIISF